MSLKPRKVDFAHSWQQLQGIIDGIVKCQGVNRQVWNEMFSEIYALTVAVPESHAERLYESTKKFLETHVKDIYQIVVNGAEEHLLQTYSQHWSNYYKGADFLNQLYRCLNPIILKQKHSDADLNFASCAEMGDQMMEIGELALETWKVQLIRPLQTVLLKLLLTEIQRDREGIPVSQPVLHNVINSLVSVEEFKKKLPLKLYEELFETAFLKQTGNYYREEAARLLTENPCSEYMEKVTMRLDEENMRSRKFLHSSSYAKVTKECQERMVADHIGLLHSDCHDFVEKERRKDLSNMYQLLSPINGGLLELVREVEEHIKRIGLAAVKDITNESAPGQFVDAVLEVHTRYSELIHSVFSGDQKFIGALDKACAAIVNYRPSPRVQCRFPELVARYCDTLLKKSAKGMSESETDDKLSQSITVFKYLDDKDIFQRHYAKMLAKRLIYQQSQSMDHEEAMINKLKQTCGYEFTNKLHRMFTDMNISADLSNKFADFLRTENTDLGVGFSIFVLQAGAWPIPQNNLPAFAIPQELERSVRMFEQFYNKHFSGRKLYWIHNLCSGDLRLGYLKKPYVVNVSTFHMGIMLCFNNSAMQSVRELVEFTKMTERDLLKHIQILIDTKILLANNDAKDLLSNSSLSLNMNYTNKRTKFKISGATQKDSAQEVEQQQAAVDEDRSMYLQAAIVRIMKARKVLKHNLLIQEVINQARTRFVPSIGLIKKSIETLIDKQYLERNQENPDEYNYLA